MPEVTAQLGQVNRLEQRRFVINPDSMRAMKRVRDKLPKLQVDYPFLSGVSFFGSRTKGAERPDSDLDFCVFYDRSKYTTTHGETASPYRDLVSIRNRIGKVAGFELEVSLAVVDISKKSTDEYIKYFTEFVGKCLDGDAIANKMGEIALLATDLSAQFFLAVGGDVYKNRAYILNQFKQMSRGEQYFQVLMKCLMQAERPSNYKYPVPTYEGLPKTIAEAEKYFLIRPNLPEEASVVA